MDLEGVECWVGRRARDHEVAAEILRQAILSGRLQAGYQLPSEYALTQLMGLTRYSVRLVLAQLATEGLVKKHHGVGSFVLDVVTNANVSVVPAMMRAAGEPRRQMNELLKYRGAQTLLAVGALIASKRPPNELAEQALFELSMLTGADLYADNVLRLEEWIWAHLGGSCSNTVVQLTAHRLRRLLTGFHVHLPETMTLERQTRLFEELFAAIKARDRLKAYALTEACLDARKGLYVALAEAEAPDAHEPPAANDDGAPAMGA